MTLKTKKDPVQEVSFSTRQQQEAIRILKEAITEKGHFGYLAYLFD
jgi:hypothetical protein